VSLLLVAAVLVALFGWQMFLSNRATSIQTKTQEAEKEILSDELSRKEITRRLLVDKLDAAAVFLTTQPVYSEGVEEILNVIKKAGATLTNSEFGNDGVFSITGKAKTSKVLGKVIEGLVKKKMNDTFGQVELSKLALEEKDEPYVFTIDMKFLKKGLMSATPSAQTK
jgi:hypothetical protein